MYNFQLHHLINTRLQQKKIDIAGADNEFYMRFIANAPHLEALYNDIYGNHPDRNIYFQRLVDKIIRSYQERPKAFIKRDEEKERRGHWILGNEIAGMSLYVDRFCGNLKQLQKKLPYFEDLGINLLHLMPLFESPDGESDGGYAVSNFRKVDSRFGTISDLKKLQQQMMGKNMYLMLDIVLNHTSQHHEWAVKARNGDQSYQDYFYFFEDRTLPDLYDQSMPEVFPESAPGNFTFIDELNKWVMTVFHAYQWDLNFTNPKVLEEMIENIFFFANIGVDILRIDAPAFIWKEVGTTSQNLPQAHTLLRLIKQAVNIATPGMAILGEAIVAPENIMKYFGTDLYAGKECDVAYNATQMALQWDMLATGDTRVMLAAQSILLGKPMGSTWLNYTRCHDDIGLGYADWMIEAAGYNAYEHRKYIKEYYAGIFPGSPATGALFAVNPTTQDARICGSLASLCGLETAIAGGNDEEISTAIKKIELLQAHSFFLGGIPMLFYGDELACTNDYSYQNDNTKSYDSRWMHRPIVDWNHITKELAKSGSVVNRIYQATKKLLFIRKSLQVIADYSNIKWASPHNIHVAMYLRSKNEKAFWGLFNFSNQEAWLTWYSFREHGINPINLYDHCTEELVVVGKDYEYLKLAPYQCRLFEMK